MWVDDIEPHEPVSGPEIHGVADISEDSGKSFETYAFTLLLSDHAYDHYRSGELIDSLTSPDADGWLVISRENKELTVRCT